MNQREDMGHITGDRIVPGEFPGIGPDVAATFNAPACVVVANMEKSRTVPDLEPAKDAPVREPVSPEHRIVSRGMLHNVNGRLNVCGWMPVPLLRYDRSRIKGIRLRVKEWNRYLINDDEYALWVTVANLSYAALVSARVTNLVHPSSHAVSIITPLLGKRLVLPANSMGGITEFENRRGRFLCRAQNDERRIIARFDKFLDGESLAIDALLDYAPRESLSNVLAWPDDQKSFHYHRVVPAMRASGSFKVGRRVHGFSPTRSFGLFAWNRGVLPYENEFRWAAAQGWQDGKGGSACDTHKVGLQFVQGMDERHATQNAIFVDGRVVKLGEATIDIPAADVSTDGKSLSDRFDMLGAWHISDCDGQVDLTFVPAKDTAEYVNAYAMLVDRHQVFGDFSGTVTVDGRPFVLRNLHGTTAIEHTRL